MCGSHNIATPTEICRCVYLDLAGSSWIWLVRRSPVACDIHAWYNLFFTHSINLRCKIKIYVTSKYLSNGFILSLCSWIYLARFFFTEISSNKYLRSTLHFETEVIDNYVLGLSSINFVGYSWFLVHRVMWHEFGAAMFYVMSNSHG
jgi:hypothetical protein